MFNFKKKNPEPVTQPDLVQEPLKITHPQEYLDVLKIRCPYCGNRFAERRHVINNIREAVYLCTYCGKRVK